MAYRAEEYTISVRKESVDGDCYWVARVEELPDVMEFGDTREDAYTAAIDTIEIGQQMCQDQGTQFPKPKSFDDIEASGRVTLRMPKPLHIQCIRRAHDSGVSLNTLLILDIQASLSRSEVSSHLSEELSFIKEMLSNKLNNIVEAPSVPNFTVSRAGRVKAPIFYIDEDSENFEKNNNSVSIHAFQRPHHA